MTTISAANAMGSGQPAIRVMLVDDSAIVRGLMARALKDDPEISVVATASDGEMALNMVKDYDVDVLILDIEMPNMDGITALPKLLQASPKTKVIMASTLTERNASISLEALSLGASDYVPKPSSRENREALDDFYRELMNKVKALGGAKKPAQITPKAPAASPETNRVAGSWKMPKQDVKAIAIASSTGGPKALTIVLSGLKGVVLPVPVFITQHMPPKFTALLAEHLTKDTGCKVVEASHGMAVEAGTFYIAPGDYHMIPVTSGAGLKITLSQDPPVNFCRPAADPMFDALAAIYRGHLLGVVLTGMGSDGKNGAHTIVGQGGTVVAQDEATCVVWGMPRAVTQANLCTEVLALDDISNYIRSALKR